MLFNLLPMQLLLLSSHLTAFLTYSLHVCTWAIPSTFFIYLTVVCCCSISLMHKLLRKNASVWYRSVAIAPSLNDMAFFVYTLIFTKYTKIRIKWTRIFMYYWSNVHDLYVIIGGVFVCAFWHGSWLCCMVWRLWKWQKRNYLAAFLCRPKWRPFAKYNWKTHWTAQIMHTWMLLSTYISFSILLRIVRLSPRKRFILQQVMLTVNVNAG